jgi:hypothetical protein
MRVSTVSGVESDFTVASETCAVAGRDPSITIAMDMAKAVAEGVFARYRRSKFMLNPLCYLAFAPNPSKR